LFPFLNIGPFHIQLYYVLMSVALAIPLWYTPERARRHIPGREREVSDMVLWMTVACLAGFRLFHVVFELPGYYLAHPLDIFAFWKGGFVAYGGLFAAVGVAWWWIRRKGLPALATADVLAAPAAAVFVVARLGCFAQGCCYGAVTSSPLGLTFPPGGTVPTPLPVHPTQLYMSGTALLIWGAILFFERVQPRRYFPGLSTAIFLVLLSAFRFLVEDFRADFRGDTFLGLTVSQGLSLVLAGLGVWVFLLGRRAAFQTAVGRQ
jgi:phosphatidylglycerol:prolipoprotein diacylglycerol transferase